MITVSVPAIVDLCLYAYMMEWAKDHCSSFVESSTIRNDLDRPLWLTDWHNEFYFRDRGDAAWFRLKWGV